MDKLINRISDIKAALDRGFSRLGPSVSGPGGMEEVLWRAANQVVRLSNALIVLCKDGYVTEGHTLLRRLMQVALEMRWLAARVKGQSGSKKQRAPEPLKWPPSGFPQALIKAGISRRELAEIYQSMRAQEDEALESVYPSIPWAHAFTRQAQASPPAEEVLDLTVRAMEHSLKALEDYWPGFFKAV